MIEFWFWRDSFPSKEKRDMMLELEAIIKSVSIGKKITHGISIKNYIKNSPWQYNGK
jgi:hypothetical protein